MEWILKGNYSHSELLMYQGTATVINSYVVVLMMGLNGKIDSYL
jgi:hypothetical protein